MLNSDPEVLWADSWRKYGTGGEILGGGGGRYGVDKTSRAKNQKWHAGVPWSSRPVRNDQGTSWSWFLMVLAKNSSKKHWKNRK